MPTYSRVATKKSGCRRLTAHISAPIVLGPQVFTEAFDAVIKAVEAGEITEQRIDESVRRILKLKQSIRK